MDAVTLGSNPPAEAWPESLVGAHERLCRDLERVATLVLGSRAEAEDVVQDVFVSASTRWSEVEHPDAYLRAAVVNRCRSVLRRRATAERLRPDPPPPDAPEQLVELRDVLLALPLRQRTVIALRYIEGLDDHTIAGVLDCRPATVRSLRARGLRQIRKELT